MYIWRNAGGRGEQGVNGYVKWRYSNTSTCRGLL